jgi:hypothetical protein
VNREDARLFRTFSDMFRKPYGPIAEYFLKLDTEKKEQFRQEIKKAIKNATAYKGEKKK